MSHFNDLAEQMGARDGDDPREPTTPDTCRVCGKYAVYWRPDGGLCTFHHDEACRAETAAYLAWADRAWQAVQDVDGGQ